MSSDLQALEWNCLVVYYCVGNAPKVQMKSWSTSDKVVLKELRNQLMILSESPLRHVGTMATNRIEVNVGCGERIVMFILQDDRISAHDPDHPKRSYSLEVDPTFVAALRRRIERDTGETPRFAYLKDVEVKGGSSP